MDILEEKLNKLNEEQKNYVYDDSFIKDKTATSIIAFAGSGKSTSIICKVARMILVHNINPSEFFITTFTRNAGNELYEKLLEFIPEKIVKNMNIGTFHSIARNYYKLENDIIEIVQSEPDKYLYFFNDYLDRRDNKFKYIFIDEYQDINILQEEIIRKLYRSGKMLTVVGDPQQNIYAFRNTDNSFILNFTKNYKNSNVIYFTKNYRSNPNIIAFSNIILKYTNVKHDKYMESMSTFKPQKIIIKKYDNFNEELKQIKDFVDFLKGKEKPLENFCIVARNNKTLRLVEEYLVKYNIPVYYIESMNNNEEARENIQKIKNRVILCTVHATKGLEFEYVFLIETKEGIFPSFLSTDIEEERRLFYVACTRAKKTLTITYNVSGDFDSMSRFLHEVIHDNDSKDIITFNPSMEHINYSSVTNNHKNFTVTDILEGLNFKDYEHIKNNIYDFNEKNPEIFRINPKTPKTFNVFCKKKPKLLLTNINVIFGDFMENFICRTINKSKKKEITNFHYEMMALKYGKRFNVRDLDELDQRFNTNFNTFSKLELDDYNAALVDYKRIIKNIVAYQDNFSNCYKDFISDKQSSKIIFEILVVSLVKQITAGRTSLQYIINFNDEIKNPAKINRSDFDIYQEWLEELENKIIEFFKKYKSVEYSKRISDDETGLIGIIDVLVDDTVIEIKSFSNDSIDTKTFCQALIYSAILKRQGKIINNLIIYNPIYGKMYKWNVSKWKKYDDLIMFLRDKALG